MIDDVLRFLLSALNSHLDTRLGRSSEPYAVLAPLAQLDGTPSQGIEQRVILTVVSIEREAAMGGTSPRPVRSTATGFIRTAAPLNLNLHVLMSAHHSKYSEALHRLSLALGFIQANPSFDHSNTVDFPDDLERLTLELANVDFQTLNNLWAVCGTKYLPSVLLKLRMLTIDQRRAEQRVPSIEGLDRQITPAPDGATT